MLEASKAIAQRSEENTATAEEEEIEREAPQRLGFLLKNIKRPKYIIERVLTEGACGFIAGEPKCYKSWVGLDMILSVATGASFMGEFRVLNPGPVLYIQEEDPPTIIKQRAGKVWAGKATDKFELAPDTNEILWLPPEREPEFDPDINAYIQKGVTISDEAWQLWRCPVHGLERFLSEHDAHPTGTQPGGEARTGAVGAKAFVEVDRGQQHRDHPSSGSGGRSQGNGLPRGGLLAEGLPQDVQWVGRLVGLALTLTGEDAGDELKHRVEIIREVDEPEVVAVGQASLDGGLPDRTGAQHAPVGHMRSQEGETVIDVVDLRGDL